MWLALYLVRYLTLIVAGIVPGKVPNIDCSWHFMDCTKVNIPFPCMLLAEISIEHSDSKAFNCICIHLKAVCYYTLAYLHTQTSFGSVCITSVSPVSNPTEVERREQHVTSRSSWSLQKVWGVHYNESGAVLSYVSLAQS